MRGDRYPDFEIQDRESVNEAHHGFDSDTGRAARFHFRIARVPSTRQLLVIHLAGSTELERHRAVEGAAAYRRRGHAALGLAHGNWQRCARRSGPGWYFVSPVLGYFVDFDALLDRILCEAPVQTSTRLDTVSGAAA